MGQGRNAAGLICEAPLSFYTVFRRRPLEQDMKRLFPGVRGRFVELVTPSSKKFNLAVTVSGRWLCDWCCGNYDQTASRIGGWGRSVECYNTNVAFTSSPVYRRPQYVRC